jgi:hypothetical protein
VVWGDSEPFNFFFFFAVGLQSMPSILSNLTSLDTNMALLALRLVVYHLPEGNLFPWLLGLLTYFRICTESLGMVCIYKVHT